METNNNIPTFSPITINDKDLITSFTLQSDFCNCDFSFANMCSWQFLYDSEYMIKDGFLLVRFRIEAKSRFAYMHPVGNGDFNKIIRFIEEDSIANGSPLLLLGIGPEAKERLEMTFPNVFEFTPERDFFDYIYLRDDLEFLQGKKLQSKRNHINKFNSLYKYEYIPITQETVPMCMELETLWYSNHSEENENRLQAERRSMTYALNNYDKLGIIGGAIKVDNDIVAFTYGAPINHKTFGVHVEKANVNYVGAYPVINKEFVSRLPKEYIYINREEDLGFPGLRKAKLSYNPFKLLEKYAATRK
jgi:Uncharacterized conserved protein